MSARFEAPKGTFDHLPPEAGIRAEVERVMLEQARLAGYQPIEDYNGNPHAGHWFEKALAVEPSVGS